MLVATRKEKGGVVAGVRGEEGVVAENGSVAYSVGACGEGLFLFWWRAV
jgi:hypothetical protein